MKPRVLVTSNDVPTSGIDLLRTKCDVTIIQTAMPNREDVLQILPGHDAIFVTGHISINSDFLNNAGSSLKVVSTMSAGYDHLDVPEIKRRGIKVGHTPMVLSAAVAEIAVLLTLNAARRTHEGRLKLEQGQVARSLQWLLGQELRGSTVGIVGLGNIGQAIVKRLKGFDVDRFIYTGHSRKKAGDELGAHYVSLDDLLAQSDFVIVAAPLNNETRGLFDDDTFSKMKRNAVFVNIARGQIVKTDALIRALRNNTIFAAGLDVTDPEPLPPDHELLKLPNAVVIPHLGSATMKTRNDMSLTAAQNILNGLEARLANFPSGVSTGSKRSIVRDFFKRRPASSRREANSFEEISRAEYARFANNTSGFLSDSRSNLNGVIHSNCGTPFSFASSRAACTLNFSLACTNTCK